MATRASHSVPTWKPWRRHGAWRRVVWSLLKLNRKCPPFGSQSISCETRFTKVQGMCNWQNPKTRETGIPARDYLRGRRGEKPSLLQQSATFPSSFQFLPFSPIPSIFFLCHASNRWEIGFKTNTNELPTCTGAKWPPTVKPGSHLSRS